MAKQRSLRRLIQNYSLLELFFTIIVISSALLGVKFLMAAGWLYPANFAEKQLDTVEKQIGKAEWTIEQLPYYYNAQVIEDGKITQTIPKKYNELIADAKKDGSSHTNRLFGQIIFIAVSNDYREVVLSYQLTAFPSSEKWFERLPNVEILYPLGVFLIWIIGFLGLIYRCTKKLQLELAKINRTNEKIREMNLSYDKEYSAYKEIQQLLDSLDSMNQELHGTLEELWQSQNQQKQLIQDVTHDVRTPITLIKGNLELLEEELDARYDDRLNDVQRGVERLEQFIMELKESANEVIKQPIRPNLIDDWIQFAQNLVTPTHQLVVVQKEESSLQVNQQAITRVLQNILMNSIEHTKVGTTITLSFEDYSDYYKIEVTDQGGFSSEALEQATQRFYTTKKNTANHGLGLAIVTEILERNNGQLFLDNHLQGAVVTIILWKNTYTASD
uniref:sensor histidine kinase n=1 Tax=Candidatus Enterococcus willemsii TaxID=1857215 RepID=UPI00403F47D5